MSSLVKSIVIVLTFIVSHMFMKELWGDTWSAQLLALDGETYILHSLVSRLFIYGPFLVITLILFKDSDWLDITGLKLKGVMYYLGAALFCCAIMVVGYALISTEANFDIPTIITSSVYPAFFEEMVFRAVLFGVLFRFCGWGFVPAALVSSLIFGVGHLYQSNDLSSAIMLIAFMAVAGSWFAWLYCECNYRIWFPMWMHFIMNASYGVFNMSGGAMGDLHGNLFKATAIILSILFVKRMIKQGKPREVTKDRLWKNQRNTRPSNPSENTVFLTN